MKRHILHFATMLLAGAGFVMASCSDSDTDNGKGKLPEPNFPSQVVTKTVAAGETCDIEIEPNQEWEVSVPKEGESAKWFWIVDGEHTVYSKSGQAGKTTVTIGVSSLEEFDTERSVEVTLTMGAVSKPIAKIVRGKVDRSLAVYVCGYENDDFVYNPEVGGDQTTYLYGTEPASSVTLLWPEGRTGFMYPIKIEANFDWYIAEKPDWITNLKVNSGEAGKWVEIRLEGDKTQYPLDGDTGKLIFHDKDNTDVSYEFGLEIPGCRDIFKVSGFSAESKFNYKAEFYNAGNGDWIPGSAMGSILGIKGAKVYVFTEVQQQWGGDPYLSTEGTEWMVIDEAAWDTSSEGGVIQDRDLNIGVKENNGEARKGLIIALPASVAETITDPDMQLVDGNAVREEFKKYVVTSVSQSGTPGSIEPVNPTGMAEIGTGFEKLASNDWILSSFSVKDGYKLIYTEEWSNDPEATLKTVDATKPVTGASYYDYDQNEMTGDASWLAMRQVEGGFIIDMDPSKDQCGASSMQYEGIAHMGFVVLTNADGKLAVLQCIYDESYPIGGGEEFDLAFSYPDIVTGASLVRVTQENVDQMSTEYPALKADFEEQLGMGTPIYVLKYTSATPNTATLKATAAFPNVMVMPMSGAEWLDFERMGDTEILINMTKPTADQEQLGMVQLFDGNWGLMAIVYCHPAF